MLPSGHHRLLSRGTSTSFRRGASTDGGHPAGIDASSTAFCRELGQGSQGGFEEWEPNLKAAALSFAVDLALHSTLGFLRHSMR